jgi:choline dehydrogenase
MNPNAETGGPLPEVVDYMVVGAGSSGVVMAARLSADPDTSVLLLEAGDVMDPEIIRVPARAPALWSGPTAYENPTVPQAGLGGRSVGLTTGRGLGGSSGINGLGWLRGRPDDFDGWAEQGAKGWGWADMAPYLNLIEDHELGAGERRGAGGPMAVHTPYHLHPATIRYLAAGQEMGWAVEPDLNGAGGECVGLTPGNMRDGARHSVLDGYLDPARTWPNLMVRTGRQVERIELDGDRAAGVHCGQQQVRARRSVILCAGALRTPQLLSLSGLGPRAQLRRPAAQSGFDTDPELVYQLSRRGPLAALGQASATVRSTPEVAVPDLQLSITMGTWDVTNTAPMATCLIALLAPDSRGTVTLRSADPADSPVFDPGYLADRRDHDRLRHGIRTALRLFAVPALGSILGPVMGLTDDPSDADLDDYLVANTSTYWHPVGTARMGTDPMSVVDLDLAVHGVTGLRIADASVIPTIPRANTQATVIAVAERAAAQVIAAR